MPSHPHHQQGVPAGPPIYLGVPIPPPPPNPPYLAPLPGFNVDSVYEKVRKAMKVKTRTFFQVNAIMINGFRRALERTKRP
jgi:hypothetical protein